tara:strand:+ start:441 stop:548 length:108 start_codon:yes stop_codon:yes gene_type:complete
MVVKKMQRKLTEWNMEIENGTTQTTLTEWGLTFDV